MFGQREPTVRVVNRVRDETGAPVPHDFMFGGEAGRITDYLDLPVGVARVVIHHSMFRMEPVNSVPEYTLGCAELGADESPLAVADTKRSELVDRRLLPPARQFGAKDKFGRTFKTVEIYNPINPRRDASPIGPRPTEGGVHPGEFGDRL